MTDLALSDEQEALRASARAFLQRACPMELVRRVRTTDGEGHDPDLWRTMAELGWVALAFPEPLGGGGGDLVDLAVLYEEAGRALVPTTLYSTVEAAFLIDRAGDEGQRAGLLRPVFVGDRIVSVAYLEDGMRSSADALSTTAVVDGGNVVVDGTKLFVPNAGVADDLVVVALDPSASGADAVRLVVVPTDAPGLCRSRLTTFAHDAQHEVSFEAVRVPMDRLLARVSWNAWSAVEEVRRLATALQCVEMVGGARAVLDLTVRYVTDRAQFGRPIGSFQAVQHHVANLSTRIDAAGLAAWQAVWRCSRGGDRDAAIGGAEAQVAIAKVACGDAYVEATLMAHQLHGAIGFTVDHDLHLWSDRARAAALTFGSRDDHLRALGSLIARWRDEFHSVRPSIAVARQTEGSVVMGKVVVSQFISVDGVVEDPGGSENWERGGWAFQFDRGPEGNQFKLDEVMASKALLLGRVTYEGFADAWPSRTGDFADKFNGMPKYVVSTTLKDPEWNNSTVIEDDVPAAVARLKRDVDGDILVNGSVQLVQTLAELGLVDEYRFMVFPTVLGAGKRLFGETPAAAPLRLVDAKPAGETFILTYEPAAQNDDKDEDA